MQLEIYNPKGEIADDMIASFLKRCEIVLKKMDVVSKQAKIEMSVAMVDSAEMRRLNMKYRSEDEPTDVLSFCYEQDKATISGEIILCPDVIRTYAQEDGQPFEQEVRKNIAHGLLHVLGLEHGEKMFSLQDELVRGC